jgi:YgiT-type zinc finger domain-containing protein
MICLVCRQVAIGNGLTSISFERGEMRIIVNNVPARLCPACAEAYLDEEVAAKLLQDAESMSNAGINHVIHEYGADLV